MTRETMTILWRVPSQPSGRNSMRLRRRQDLRALAPTLARTRMPQTPLMMWARLLWRKRFPMWRLAAEAASALGVATRRVRDAPAVLLISPTSNLVCYLALQVAQTTRMWH